MHSYDKQFNVMADGYSHYTNDPVEALSILDNARNKDKAFCAEGYAEYIDREGGYEIYRRTTGEATRQHLVSLITDIEYQNHRAEVQRMIARLRSK
jgi:hypothetical protein